MLFFQYPSIAMVVVVLVFFIIAFRFFVEYGQCSFLYWQSVLFIHWFRFWYNTMTIMLFIFIFVQLSIFNCFLGNISFTNTTGIWRIEERILFPHGIPLCFL